VLTGPANAEFWSLFINGGPFIEAPNFSSTARVIGRSPTLSGQPFIEASETAAPQWFAAAVAALSERPFIEAPVQQGVACRRRLVTAPERTP
jgi:hypothetical protein